MANKQIRKVILTRPNRAPQQVAAISNLLNAFVDTMSTGYSDEAWTQAGRAYRRLSGYLGQSERDILANAWRNCYVDQNADAVRQATDQVRARL